MAGGWLLKKPFCWWLLKSRFKRSQQLHGDVEGNPTKVVNDVPVVEVLYDIENPLIAVLVLATLRSG